VLGVQVAVEPQHLEVVLNEGVERVREPGTREVLAGGAALGGPLAEVGVLGPEPGEPGGHVGEDRGGDEGEERRHAAPEDACADPQARARGATGLDLPQERGDPERRGCVQARPLDPGGHAERDPRHDHPPANPGGWTPGVGEGVAGPGVPRGQPGAAEFPVLEQRPEPHEHEQGEEAIEEGRAGVGDRYPVQRDERRGRRGEEGGAEQPVRDPPHEQDRERARDRHREAPAQAGVRAEQPHPKGDQPLPDVAVHHIGRIVRHLVVVPGDEVGVRALLLVVGFPLGGVPVLVEGEGVLDVVGLVEDQFRGVVQVREAQHAAEHHHEQRAEPGPQPDVRREPVAQRGEAEHAAVAVLAVELALHDETRARLLGRAGGTHP